MTEHSTLNLDRERRRKLVKLALELGYVSQYRMEETGNLTGLIRAIADGEVRVVRDRVLVDSQEEYHV